MSIIETQTTVSHRYYRRKRKSEIVARIRDLRAILGDRGIPISKNLESALSSTDRDLVKLSADDLARIAIRLHTFFPEDANSK